jgi:hypothetical protein
VGGQFYNEQSTRFQLKQLGILAIPIIKWVSRKREENKRRYDAIDPMSSAFLAENKNNFRIFKEEINQILIKKTRSWWTGGAPNSGIIRLDMAKGKK